MSMSNVPSNKFERCCICFVMEDHRPSLGSDGRPSTIEVSRYGKADTGKAAVGFDPGRSRFLRHCPDRRLLSRNSTEALIPGSCMSQGSCRVRCR